MYCLYTKYMSRASEAKTPTGSLNINEPESTNTPPSKVVRHYYTIPMFHYSKILGIPLVLYKVLGTCVEAMNKPSCCYVRHLEFFGKVRVRSGNYGTT